MFSRLRSSVLLCGALASVGMLGCGAPAPEAPIPDPDTVRLEGAELPDSVQGEVGGVAFAAIDARYRITHGERRERVDLYFSDRHIDRCGLPVARPDTLVWLRAPERSSIEVEELTTEASGLEVHYERPGEDGIEAVHRGVARLSVTGIEEGVVSGAVRVCFADAAASCVGGRFHATPCLSRVDGRALREPPGLDDDAIEATGEAP